MTTSALQTIQNFQESMAKGSEDWKDLFTEDVVFEGPIDQVYGKVATIRLHESFNPLVKEHKLISAIEQGHTVALQTELSVASPSGKELKLPVAEFYEVENGKIKSIKIFYDAQEFRQEFAVC